MYPFTFVNCELSTTLKLLNNGFGFVTLPYEPTRIPFNSGKEHLSVITLPRSINNESPSTILPTATVKLFTGVVSVNPSLLSLPLSGDQ